MTTDQPQLLPPARQDDHEHAWRSVDIEDPGWASVYRCEICHRTWASFVT